MPTALAISPHLDDAVFSAGGTLARRARQGWRVIVATVFTASVTDPRGFALACQLDKGLPPEIDYMALRRDEDAAACAIIGAEAIWLPFVEAPHRGYRSAAELFEGLHGNDTIVESITLAIADLVRSLAPDEIFAPQAIGAHVDHVAVYLALRSYDRSLSLWADFPYIVRPSAKPSPFEKEIGRSSREVRLSPDEVRAKEAAASRYASQLGFQFGGAKELRSAMQDVGCEEAFAARHGPDASDQLRPTAASRLEVSSRAASPSKAGLPR